MRLHARTAVITAGFCGRGGKTACSDKLKMPINLSSPPSDRKDMRHARHFALRLRPDRRPCAFPARLLHGGAGAAWAGEGRRRLPFSGVECGDRTRHHEPAGDRHRHPLAVVAFGELPAGRGKARALPRREPRRAPAGARPSRPLRPVRQPAPAGHRCVAQGDRLCLRRARRRRDHDGIQHQRRLSRRAALRAGLRRAEPPRGHPVRPPHGACLQRP